MQYDNNFSHFLFVLATQTTVKQNLTSAAACHGYAEAADPDPERRTRSCKGWGAVDGEHPKGGILSHDVLVAVSSVPTAEPTVANVKRAFPFLTPLTPRQRDSASTGVVADGEEALSP